MDQIPRYLGTAESPFKQAGVSDPDRTIISHLDLVESILVDPFINFIRGCPPSDPPPLTEQEIKKGIHYRVKGVTAVVMVFSESDASGYSFIDDVMNNLIVDNDGTLLKIVSTAPSDLDSRKGKSYIKYAEFTKCNKLGMKVTSQTVDARTFNGYLQ